MKVKNLGQIWSSILIFLTLLASSSSLFDQTTPLRFFLWTVVLIILYFQLRKQAVAYSFGSLSIIILFAFALWETISILFAGNKTLVLPNLQRDVLLLTSILVFSKYFSLKANSLVNFFKLIVLISFVLNIKGFYDLCQNSNYFQLPDRNNYFVASFFSNKNLYASFLLLIIPFKVYLIIKEIKHWKLISLIALAFSAFMIVNLNTRSVWVAALVFIFFSLIVFFYYLKFNGFKFFNQFKAEKKYLVSLVIFVFVIIGFKLFTLDKKPADKFEGLINESNQSSVIINSGNERLLLWQKSWEIFLKHPLMGVGSGNWKREINGQGITNTIAEKGNVYFISPHNETINVLVENGIIGVLLFSAFFAMIVYNGVKIILKKNEHSLSAYISTSVMLIFIVYSQFEFPFSRPEHVFVLAIGLAIQVAWQLGNRTIKIPQAIIFSFLVVVLVFSLNSLKFNYFLLKINEDRERADWIQLIRNGNRAKSVFVSMDANAMPLEWYIGIAHYHLGDINKATQCFEKAKKQSPYNLHVLNNLGSCYNTVGNSNMAKELFKEALRVSESFDEARINYCITLFNENDFVNCKQELRKLSDKDVIEKNLDFIIEVINPERNLGIKKAEDVLLFFKDSSNLNRKI